MQVLKLCVVQFCQLKLCEVQICQFLSCVWYKPVNFGAGKRLVDLLDIHGRCWFQIEQGPLTGIELARWVCGTNPLTLQIC